MTNRLVFVQGDEWEGVYVDGKLVTEGHHIEALDLLEIALDFGVTEFDRREAVVNCDIDWLNDLVGLPEDLADVVVED